MLQPNPVVAPKARDWPCPIHQRGVPDPLDKDNDGKLEIKRENRIREIFDFLTQDTPNLNDSDEEPSVEEGKEASVEQGK